MLASLPIGDLVKNRRSGSRPLRSNVALWEPHGDVELMSPLRRSRRTERFRPRASITARTGSGHRSERQTFLAMKNVRYWHKADFRIVANHVCFWGESGRHVGSCF